MIASERVDDTADSLIIFSPDRDVAFTFAANAS
jgi:hypothetical protein